MVWHVTSDVAEFEDAAADFLRADPVRNTVLLSVAAILRRRGADAYGDDTPRFGWYQAVGETVRGAFLRTPPRAALLSDLPAAAVGPLAAVILEENAGAVDGPAATIAAFADAWTAATGRGSKVSARHRLYRLADLTPPRPLPEGSARPATSADRDLVIDWFAAFGAEADEPAAANPRLIDDRIANDCLMLWDVDGAPVSLAGVTLPIGGMVRVGPVYTPPALRGRGHAGAVTAAISKRAQDAGHEVVLFTDLANPTSNALYQRLGYRAVGDYQTLDLDQ